MAAEPRRMAILGCTGSIGSQALEVARLHRERFSITALTAYQNKDMLFEQVRVFRPQMAGLVRGAALMDVPDDLRFCDWVFGEETLQRAVETDCNDVLVSIVGMAGLQGVLHALSLGKRVLLANKEALVAGGKLVIAAAERAGVDRLLPVDSEHSAIFQCLQGEAGNPAECIYLTCSGGPFRGWEREAVRAAVRSQALAHPNWVMGPKITVDSATLFNKAREIIEAKWLFQMESRQIQVLIHPQSVVHSAVGFADGAILAQLGVPDMRLPILYAMSYPKRLPTGCRPLDLLAMGALTFEKPDAESFPSLRLAKEALDAGGAAACVLNAANEEAVSCFLQNVHEKDMPLGRIYDIVEETLQRLGPLPAGDLDEVLYADRRAREMAINLLRGSK